MLYLNLDPGFKAGFEMGDNIEFETFTFPGGEVSIKLPLGTAAESVMIIQRIRTSDDIMLILLTVNALREYDCVKEISLYIPYMPYGRQDRVCSKGEAFSLKVFAQLINSCGFRKVHTFDAHSDVGPALINNCLVHDNETFVLRAMRDYISLYDLQDVNIVAPDSGAVKKIYKLVQSFSTEFPDVNFSLTVCDKIRNLKTGEIIRTEVYADRVFAHSIIIDDIIDGGRTMVEVSKALRQKGTEHVTMMVSHGIFSKGYGLFVDTFDRIYTTDSFKNHTEVLVERSRHTADQPCSLVRRQHIRDEGYPSAWFQTIGII
jgi:ribose-phosphate pyrophosphokinase